uniref:Predicted protein n=1 Tax=Hordeum vulgare subsp. vulgare TaxID=112509 RepID=F2DIR2_HORVV|nr:predicted protein [Hordeum vulgare subsp. vulgare]BAK04326.1 predicted protein [Hordeum vulgare subsp. vulgare]
MKEVLTRDTQLLQSIKSRGRPWRACGAALGGRIWRRQRGWRRERRRRRRKWRGVEEKRASGKSRDVAHDADETSADLPGACGGAVREDLSDLAGPGGNWRPCGGSGRKEVGAGWDNVCAADIMALPVWQFELYSPIPTSLVAPLQVMLDG